MTSPSIERLHERFAILEARYGYHLLDAHKRVHDQFSRELLDLKQQYTAGTMAAEQLGAALSRWLFDHISKADQGAINPSSR